MHTPLSYNLTPMNRHSAISSWVLIFGGEISGAVQLKIAEVESFLSKRWALSTWRQ